ncbi:MAG: hypothetical protein KAJ16_05480 [Calditrichia bacterium]|nr:hypothetical protein [Calditrichia bacterium]
MTGRQPAFHALIDGHEVVVYLNHDRKEYAVRQLVKLVSGSIYRLTHPH